MTNQVNVTESNQPELSDDEQYEAEWADEDETVQSPSSEPSSDDTSDSDHSDDTDHGKAEETGDAASGTVGDDTQGNTSEAQEQEAGEQTNPDDIWADAPEHLRQAYLKAQNDLNAQTGRLDAERKRIQQLEDNLNSTSAELREHTREKGEYETEHPELFKEVLTVFESRLPQVTQPAESENTEEELTDEIKLVLKYHPDVHDLMATPEWAAAEQNFTPEQKLQFDSPDPVEFINLVSNVKQNLANQATQSSSSSAQERLEQATTAGPSGQPSSPAKVNLTDDEQYDAEWEKDD